MKEVERTAGGIAPLLCITSYCDLCQQMDFRIHGNLERRVRRDWWRRLGFVGFLGWGKWSEGNLCGMWRYVANRCDRCDGRRWSEMAVWCAGIGALECCNAVVDADEEEERYRLASFVWLWWLFWRVFVSICVSDYLDSGLNVGSLRREVAQFILSIQSHT